MYRLYSEISDQDIFSEISPWAYARSSFKNEIENPFLVGIKIYKN